MTALDVLLAHVLWMAQTVHQAYHHDGSWRECGAAICLSTVHVLRELGLPAPDVPVLPASPHAQPRIHVLHRGFPLCRFTREMPGQWPTGELWVHKEDAAQATCETCRARAVELMKATAALPAPAPPR